jgi:lysozyme family protein
MDDPNSQREAPPPPDWIRTLAAGPGSEQKQPGSAARKGGAAAAAIALILSGVYAVEGGFSNNRNDPGGATNFGVTEQVARANGYHGDMRRFPKHCDGPATACADAVYVKSYIAAPGYMPLVEIEPAVAGEMVDTAVNMGPARPNRWFRATMNHLASTRLPASSAKLGAADITAYRMVQVKLGVTPACVATLDALDGLQEAEYRRLAAASAKLRTFLKGWLAHRIGNVDRKTCGKGFD